MNKRIFEASVKKLRNFAKNRNINVRIIPESITDLPYIGYFDPTNRRIRISGLVKKVRSEFIYVLAHEIGHSIDFDTMTKRDKKLHDNACIVFHRALATGVKIPKRLRDFIISREKAANKNGENLIRDFAIPIRKDLIPFYRNGGIEGYKRLFAMI